MSSVDGKNDSDLLYNEEGSGDILVDNSNQIIERSTVKSSNASNLEMAHQSDRFSCDMDSQQLNREVKQIIKNYIPTQLKLKDFIRGRFTKVSLKNGRLIVNNEISLIGQPICYKGEGKVKMYDFMVAFDDLEGFYDWKIHNFFNTNFAESATIIIDRLRSQFIFEVNDGNIILNDIKVGKIEDINVKVNIPENITDNKLLKHAMQYLMSRLTTLIANRSKDTIAKNMKKILFNGVKQLLNKSSE